MKAISLWQPWASLMAVGSKRFETRSWPTSHRGELAVCAAKKWSDDLNQILQGERFQTALNPHYQCHRDNPVHLWDLPRGMVVAVVEVYGCVPTTRVVAHDGVPDVPTNAAELAFGDYAPGRFAWLTRDCRKLARPVPVVGRQGLFNLPGEVEVQVRAQLWAQQ